MNSKFISPQYCISIKPASAKFLYGVRVQNLDILARGQFGFNGLIINVEQVMELDITNVHEHLLMALDGKVFLKEMILVF